MSSITNQLGILPFLTSVFHGVNISTSFTKFEAVIGLPHLKNQTRVAVSFLDNKVKIKNCLIHVAPYGSIDNVCCLCSFSRC